MSRQKQFARPNSLHISSDDIFKISINERHDLALRVCYHQGRATTCGGFYTRAILSPRICLVADDFTDGVG